MKQNKKETTQKKRRGGVTSTRLSQRVLAAMLSVVLTVGLCPGLSWAENASAGEAAGESATVTVEAPATNATGAAEAAAQEQASNSVEVVEIGGEQEVANTVTTKAAAEEEALEAEAVYEPLANETVTVGSGTYSTNYTPYHNSYTNAGTQIIYKASEIGKTGKITSFAFNVASINTSKGAVNNTEFKVYMGLTDKDTFSAKDDAISKSDLTLVYNSTTQQIGEATGWETIQLDTPFSYDSSKNLVVAIYRKATTYAGSSLKYYYTSTSNTVLYRGNDNDATYGDIDGSGSYSLTSYRPNIQLTVNTCEHTSLTHHDAVAPACGNGNIEYWSCNACGDLFSDSAAQSPITSIKADHSWGTGVKTTVPTCSETGTLTYTCSVCNETREEVIPATKNHHFVNGFCDNKLRDGVTICNVEDKWDGETLDEPAQVDGVYQIKTGEEFAWFMNEAKTNAYAGKAKLTRDINMGTLTLWYLSGGSSAANGFQGTLDGDNHAITINYSSSTSNAALFGYLGKSGVIKNLTMKGSFSGKYAGGIAIYNYGTIQNCKNEATIVSTTTTAYAGGIVGYQNQGIVEQCANYGAVTASTTSSYGYAYAGGIAAYTSTSSASVESYKATIKTCYNTGSVSATKSSTAANYYAAAGGIIGQIPSATSSSYYVVENCLNAGTITASNSADTENANGLLTGGTAGIIKYPSSPSAIQYISNLTLTNCFYIEGTAEATYVSSTAGSDAATLTNCGATTEDNTINTTWITTNLGNDTSSAWFIDILEANATRYVVTFTGANVTAQVKAKNVTSTEVVEGKTVSFTVTPDEGYGIDSVKQGDTVLEAVDGTYTTTAITNATTITIATHQHQWDSGTVNPEPTCTTKGVKTFKCTVGDCSASYTEEVATVAHTFTSEASATAEVKPTCTATGTEAYWTCDVCKQLFSDAEGTTVITAPVIINALGHDYSAYKDNGDGTHTNVCSRCSEQKPAGYDVATTGSTTMTNGKTYVIVVNGYALSCEDADLTYWRRASSYTAGVTTVDTTLLWAWSEDGSLKSVSTGQYLTNNELYKLEMSDTSSTKWMINENGQIYCVDSNSATRYLYCYNNSIYPNLQTPTTEAFYEATESKTSEAHTYTDHACTKCDNKQIIEAQAPSVLTEDPFVSVKNTVEGETNATGLYLASASVSYLAEGYVPCLGDTTMVKDGDTYKALVSKEVADAITAGTLAITAQEGTGASIPAELKGDVNASSKLNIVDAQIVYDVARARYTLETLSVASFLAADVSGDNVVDSGDAFAIQHALHCGWESNS